MDALGSVEVPFVGGPRDGQLWAMQLPLPVVYEIPRQLSMQDLMTDRKEALLPMGRVVYNRRLNDFNKMIYVYDPEASA